MADAPDISGPQLWSLVGVIWITGQDIVFYNQSAGDESKEYGKMLLPTLGVAMMVEAVSMLVFLGSTMWTGKLRRVVFICWQFIYAISCNTYALLHWNGMVGLCIGASWSASVALSVLIALHNWVETETKKSKAASTSRTGSSIADAED
ncbi:hypothetical protein MBLNU13_g03581t1 [Cladosporium sp. NU13]